MAVKDVYMTPAQKAYEFIMSSLNGGLSVYITTAYTSKRITPKTFAKWEQSGHKLFKIDSTGHLVIASGKNYNSIATPSVVLVSIKAIQE